MHQVAHPEQRLVVVGGDVHVTSSPVSNVQPALLRLLSEIAPRFDAASGSHSSSLADLRLMDPAWVEGRNPYGDLNLGLVEVRHVGGHSEVRLSLLGQSGAGVRPVLRSRWL